MTTDQLTAAQSHVQTLTSLIDGETDLLGASLGEIKDFLQSLIDQNSHGPGYYTLAIYHRLESNGPRHHIHTHHTWANTTKDATTKAIKSVDDLNLEYIETEILTYMTVAQYQAEMGTK